MKVQVLATLLLKKDIERIYKDTDKTSLTLQVMMAADGVYPVLTARKVAKWYGLKEAKAKAILVDLEKRGWLHRRGAQYCRRWDLAVR